VNDIEETIRKSLNDRVGGIGVRTMPNGTGRRISLRRIRLVAGIGLTLAAAASVVTVMALHGGAPTVGKSLDGESVSHGVWPHVVGVDPSDAFVPQGTDDRTDLAVLSAGTADGAVFSLVGWTGTNAEYRGPCISFSGPWTGSEGSNPSPDEWGGIISENCAAWHSPSVPDESDLELLGQQDVTTPAVMANYGFVSPRVARMTFAVGNPTEEIDVPLFEGPGTWDGVRAFLFFPPSEMEGMLIAYDAEGRPLARAVTCASQPDMHGGCRGRTEPLVLVGPEVPEVPMDAPPGWPEATFGGPVVPYVDHVVDLEGQMDPGIVTSKTVVAFGRVGDAPWSLTGFTADGVDIGMSGSCGEFFLGAEGAGGGGGVCLADDPDFSVSGLGFGDARVIAYVGIVSSGVHTVEVRLEDGSTWLPELLPGPAELRAQFFVFFPSEGIRGDIVAIDAGGEILGRGTMCAEVPDDAGATAGC
jgi:hypothetical protein